jgi:uncharacterized protein (TIGR00661 family)
LGHYTVYLPAVDDKHLLKLLQQIPSVKWEVFSKHTTQSYTVANVLITPINNQQFNQSLASCEGLFTGGGFEGPSEALFLGKKILVAPMKYQYEQQCNAYALKQMGFPVIWSSNKNWLPILKDFVAQSQTCQIDFPNETQRIIAQMVRDFAK